MTTNEILPGGCIPPCWPRPPIPPVPEPEPDSLDERVDWMTYSHPELYSMVHSGLDLTGAMAVSAKWARLGDELAEIGDALTKLINATAAAWQGEAADLARGSVAELADWSAQTGVSATDVSGCITIEVDNATNARNNMPAPPYPIADPGPGPDHPHAAREMPSSAAAFTSGDFGTAQTVVSDPMVWTRQEQALHQQAARTMETFQTNSREVYGTVPQFAPPDLRRMPLVDPGPPPEPQPPPQPQPPTPTTPQQTPPGLGGGGAQVGSPGGAGSGGMVGSGGRPAATADPLPGAGGAVGAAPGGPGASGQPAAASAGRAGAPGGVGGMPMGGMGGGRGGEDTERKGVKYLDEDEDLWGVNDQRVTPPVIGEDRRRA